MGDPSGRDQTRARLTPEQVEANAQDYLRQISKVVDVGRAEVVRNGDWFGKMTFLDVMGLTSKITLQRMLERDDFTKRHKEGKPIFLHECLYPLMQGQDSVEIRADVELGGTEQLFNLMMGRKLQSEAGQEPQVCVTNPILRGLDGERRMGKSLGNYVGVGMPAGEQFGRTMSIPDTLLKEWFTLLTDRPMQEVADLTDAGKTHPMEAKKALARDVVTCYHGPDAARAAQAGWEKQFSNREVPDDVKEVDVPASTLVEGKLPAYKLLVALKLAQGSNEARRLVQGGGVSLGEQKTKVSDPNQLVEVVPGLLVRAGRHWAKVRLS